MRRQASAAAIVAILAALAWAPLGVSAADSAQNPGIAADPSPSPAAGSPAPAPAAATMAPLASSTLRPAPVASITVALTTASSGAKPAAKHPATGSSTRPSTAAMRSARPGSAGAVPPVASAPSAALHSGDAPNGLDLPVTGAWVVALLTALVVLGSLVLLFGRGQRQEGETVVADRRSPHSAPVGGSVRFDRRRTDRPAGEAPVPPARPSRLQPADDPILRAMGLDPDAPAAGGARAVRAHARRVGQRPVARPRSGEPPRSEEDRVD